MSFWGGGGGGLLTHNFFLTFYNLVVVLKLFENKVIGKINEATISTDSRS